MTETRKTTVTHADGTVSRRASKTRTYSHAVEVSPAPAEAYAADLDRQARDRRDTAARYRAAADAGHVTIKSRGFGTINPDVSHQATLSGTDGYIYTWCNADAITHTLPSQGAQPVHVTEDLPRHARDTAANYDTAAEKLEAEAAAVRTAGVPVGRYGVARWSSRADLAAKALAEFEYLTAKGHQLRVVAVDA